MRPQPGVFERYPYFWLFVLGLLWGANFLFMRMAEGLEPTQVVWLRLFFGAAALAPFLPGALRSVHRDRRLWLHVTVMSLAANVLTFHCFMEGARRLGAGLAGVVSGAIPLMTALLAAAALPGERLGRGKLSGLCVSSAGIMVIMAPWHGVPAATWAGAGFMLAGAAGYAVAFVYARRFLSSSEGASPLGLAALQMAAATLLYAPLVQWSGMERLFGDWTTVVGVALGLGAFGSGAAYVVYYGLVRAMGAVAASSVTYLPPVVALGLGWAILGEAVGPGQVTGAALVLGGIALLRRA
jgi:drug/metabolite transporter (DMT)-like permease